MSELSFKNFLHFVDHESDLSDEQINEIFGLFKNNKAQDAKLAALKKKRAELKGMSAEKKKALDQALNDFASGKKPEPEAKGKIDDVDLSDYLSADDRKALAKRDKEADKKPNNYTAKPAYEGFTNEGISPVKTITKVATYRESAITKSFKAKLERVGAANDVSISIGKGRWDSNEGENFCSIKLTGTRANIKIVAKLVPVAMNDDSLNEDMDEDPSFGFEHKGNAISADKALKDAGHEFTRTNAGGVHYFHFDKMSAMRKALKVVKPAIDASKESEWGEA